MNPFEVFLTTPILNLLIAYYAALKTLFIPWALGFAIILLTVTIRLVLWPLTGVQLKSTQKMAALKPHLDRIKLEHGHDKIRHQQEVSKLYKEHGVNPLSGCLPMILQIPVFIALYNVLLKIVQVNGDFLNKINSQLYFSFLHLDKVPDTYFLGFNLSDKPNQWQQAGILILAIPILTGLLQLIQSKMLTPALPPSPSITPVKKTDSKGEIEDTMAQVSSQMTLIMPLMIAFFSYGFPVGLSLYWNTFTIIGIIQQYVISGPGALNKYLPKRWQKQS
ncbi:hypothetical protein A2697_04835 [Candidatus Curtissbacteria bacterium RIFCSPHIGHO2_01_FULL_41_44]|uniref:Membrane insertase YidC/Oxa/ALB C-terminal domain-containing protein n=1 Tax=Candidatus Curtissbacteria bacterium RIFCSPLOWO2_01_FULL_42_50 TaxID=1797730 RepID=A0A1F5H664_9BACT|nr:MAG: hypothetical protein A3C33_00285 [Candidatus Curtissbacteria bacterium RIFCSPHIGHO2_02_FULL_42_58]OGD93969.1 MAG: hypothetical protein A2697_04835 [Candidatus Curtissbacteria bacterium RIFCSPHIGHO2_01_FULL_41_44]OGD97575.1 MAG: hypothetical protein A3E71_05140 [Candidatus Curtissbacteria bacterium RIFCSPHIGHO2_12_FULL_42_33]OGD99567.1 MAG: hypothetical protein A3B54_02345 [Candidatus Curtissbacteria bacterium RIFCSPLOWO2_01_FULL_42_50]OGE02547.1 MAG: hypothetical protein A3G16_03395 [Ca